MSGLVTEGITVVAGSTNGFKRGMDTAADAIIKELPKKSKAVKLIKRFNKLELLHQMAIQKLVE